mmetsp:Transcript_87333/g.151187  ORF Transcript_87333/g.151187 Transcript_87333/m.151187 type:complete len:536 (+) Transcript_87333:2-1609(+)
MSIADFKTPRVEECSEDVTEKSLFVKRLSEAGVLKAQSHKVAEATDSHSRPFVDSSTAGCAANVDDSIDSAMQDGAETTAVDCGQTVVNKKQPGDLSALKQIMQECSESDVGVCQNKPSKSKADCQSPSLRLMQKLSKFRSEALAAWQQSTEGPFERSQEELDELTPEVPFESQRKSDVQAKSYPDEVTCSPSTCSKGGSSEEENTSTLMLEDGEEDMELDDFEDDNSSESSFRSLGAAMACDHLQDRSDKDFEDSTETASVCGADQQNMAIAHENDKGQGVVFLVEATDASFKSGFYSAVLDTLYSCLENIPTTYTNLMIILYGDGVQLFSFNTKSGVPRIVHISGEDFFLPEPLSALMVDPVPWREHLQDLIESLRSLQPPTTTASTEDLEPSAGDVNVGDADAWNAALSVAVDAAAFAGGGEVISFNASLPNVAQYGANFLSVRMLSRGKALQERFHRNIAKECRNQNVAMTPMCLKTQTAGLDESALRWLSSQTSSDLKSIDFMCPDSDRIRTALADQVQSVLSRKRSPVC